MYAKLYHHRDESVVMDDVDGHIALEASGTWRENLRRRCHAFQLRTGQRLDGRRGPSLI
jgi:hypothetical protein